MLHTYKRARMRSVAVSAFVLVHGGWHGGWCWERVVPLLEQVGHTVVAPDLPGHGRDRTPVSDRPYERYVPSIRGVVEAQPEPVILVGHSSGGMIITDVAAQRPERVRVLAYLSAFLLPLGVSPPEVMRDDAESVLVASVVVDAERGVTTVRPECAQAVFYGDCTDEDAAWAAGMLGAEPLMPRSSAATEPVAATSAEEIVTQVPRVYIECLRDRALGPATQRRMYTAMPCARVYSLTTSHSPFISAPEELAACLLDVAATFDTPVRD
ncbi:MAG: alpha/beta fold hydrolase [Dehalococcoidia bacterium]